MSYDIFFEVIGNIYKNPELLSNSTTQEGER